MSHELRTPLNAILGFTSLMLMRLPGPLTEEQEKQLQLVQTSGQHLLSLINDLLDLAKIESGSIQLALDALDWRTVVQDVVDTLRASAQGKQIDLILEVPTDAVIQTTDRRALHQIITNLVANAIKYTDQGCVNVTLSTKQTSGSRRIELSVTDTGRGISLEDQARLFQAFVRVGDPNSQQRHEGSGLGLYLCKNLAEMMGGCIELESTPGSGSRFTFAIPV
jgi:signal transduction histidine kinase